VSFLSAPTPTTVIYPLSLHDALPIYHPVRPDRWRLAWPADGVRGPASSTFHRRRVYRSAWSQCRRVQASAEPRADRHHEPTNDSDRKSTRLNSSHVKISYAVFCLKKK